LTTNSPGDSSWDCVSTLCFANGAVVMGNRSLSSTVRFIHTRTASTWRFRRSFRLKRGSRSRSSCMQPDRTVKPGDVPSLPGLENLHQRLVFLAAFRAEPEVLFDTGNDLARRLVRELAFGKFADMLQSFAAIELAVARQAQHLDDAANLFARQPLFFRFHI